MGGRAGATEAPGHCDSPEHLCKDAGTTQAHAVPKDACCPTHTHALTPRRVPACVFFLFHQLYRRKKSQENQEKHQTCYSDLASGTSQIRFSQHDTSPLKLSPFPGCCFSWWQPRWLGFRRFGKPSGRRGGGCGKDGAGPGGRQQRIGETSGNCLFRRLWGLGSKGPEAIAGLVSPSHLAQSQAVPANICGDTFPCHFSKVHLRGARMLDVRHPIRPG